MFILLFILAQLPNPKLTTGAIRPLSKTQVCNITWGLDQRHVTLTMKKHVFAAYKISWNDHSKYEVDHLISRELGGADVEINLWPQPWIGIEGAHTKDKLENLLHRRVCSGQMTLEDAQTQIKTDWVKTARTLGVIR